MFKRSALILAALALSAGSAFATNLCSPAQQSLTIFQINQYCQGQVTIGDKLFSGFSILGADSSTVNVGGFDGGSYVDIVFGGPFVINTAGQKDFTLSFQVSVIPAGWVITEIGQAITGGLGNPDAFARIDESVFGAPGPIGGTLLANSTVTWISDPNDPDGGLPEAGDNLVLSTPSSVIWVTKDILLDGGNLRGEGCGVTVECTLGASATTIMQRFYQRDDSDVPDVPEPTTMLLFSTALLGLGFMRRKKS